MLRIIDTKILIIKSKLYKKMLSKQSFLIQIFKFGPPLILKYLLALYTLIIYVCV